MTDDPNRDLGGFVEGMVMGGLQHDIIRQNAADIGWQMLFEDDLRGIHALYFISPSGLRWRIRAVLDEDPPKPAGHVPGSGMSKAAGW